MRNSTQKNLIIDANNLLHRVFHVSKVLEKSTPTSHIYLFLNSLKSLVELFSPKKLFVYGIIEKKTAIILEKC